MENSRLYKKIFLILVILIAIFLIFQLGVLVGIRKAEFSSKWGENYYKNFTHGQGFPMNAIRGDDFVGGNGTVGLIMSIDLKSPQNMSIKSEDGVEKVILIEASTTIKSFQDSLSVSDLKIGNRVVVIGVPDNSGKIEAELIRIIK